MSAVPAHTPALIRSLDDWTFGPAPRRVTRQVEIGGVRVGGGAPVVVQSMTNTDTADVASTTKQVAELWRAGSELVRVTVNNPESAAAVPRIVERLAMMGVERADHRRLPLQRPPAADERTGLRAKRWPSTASIPATSASARSATRSSPR